MIANYITIRNRIRNKLDARNAREGTFELDFRQYSNKYQINRPYTRKEQRNQKICNIVIRNKLNARTPASLCTILNGASIVIRTKLNARTPALAQNNYYKFYFIMRAK